MLCRMIAFMFVLFISGCSSYEAQNIGDNAVMIESSILNVSLDSKTDLVPNQESIVKLHVSNINGTEVDGVYITAIVKANTDLGRAIVKSKSIGFNANGKVSNIPINGYVVDVDGMIGISLGCGKENINECGVLEYSYTNNWNFIIKETVDIGNITMMVKKS
ncbi:MAG: hypothetical protein QM504_14255 [Pseudomonadota bacterium]